MKRLLRDNIRLMMRLRIAKQNLEVSHKRERILQKQLCQSQRSKMTKEGLNDDVFYDNQSLLDLHPDSCIFCRDYENSLKFDSVKDLEEYAQRNFEPKSCTFCHVAECGACSP